MQKPDGEFHWRETYFIFFSLSNRPTLTQVERVLGELNKKFELKELCANDDGLFESVLLYSPDDNAALEICLEQGETIIEQQADLVSQLSEEATKEQMRMLTQADARLDIMHFEHVSSSWEEGDENLDEMLDPGSLLLAVDALVELTGGVPIDPASGAIMP